MTIKTLTGPTVRAALADARRLFGDDVVLLESVPAEAGQPARVMVGMDAPTPPRRAPRPTPPVARPEPACAAAEPAPRAYGYAAARNARPTAPEPVSAPVPAPLVAPAVSADDLARLQARLAELEAAVARASAPPAARPAPNRTTAVLVGPAGSGRTSLALRLAHDPTLLGRWQPAVLVLAPEDGPFLDPSEAFWSAGVPVAVARTADAVHDALDTFAAADLLLVDTPALPLRPDAARPHVARLGRLLAALGPLDVHLVLDAARSVETLDPDRLAALGLRPDALALTRLDEAPPRAAAAWADRLGLPLSVVSSGPTSDDLDLARPEPSRLVPEPALAFTSVLCS